MRLENKVAIVTGAAQGIRKATAARFVREGAKVLLSDIDGTKAGAAARAICDDHAVCSAITCDVANSGELRDMVALAVERYGWLDIAVASGEASYVTGQVIYAEGAQLPLMYTVPVDEDVLR